MDSQDVIGPHLAADALRAPAPDPKCEMSAEQVAATLTIHDADRMTMKGREAVANWLRRQADMLEADGTDYAGRFRARYLY